MTEIFDEIVPRKGTDSSKHDDLLSRFGKADLQPLWVADMDFRAPDCVRRALRELADHNLYGYHLKAAHYYHAIAAWWARRHRYEVDPASVSWSPGVVPVVSHLVQALTRPGDGILLQPPVYHPFFWAVQANGRTLVENRLLERGDEYTIDFDDLETKARQARLMILCSPHNPVGRVWTREELSRVAEICLKNRVTIISDEIHNDLVFAPHVHVPIASLSPEVDRITVTCHAASKTFNLAGLSTAYIVIKNPEIRQAYKAVADLLHVEALNPFGLRATEVAFNEGEPWLADLMAYLAGNVRAVRDFLGTSLPRVTMSPIEGTYLAWLDFRAYGFAPAALKERMIQKAGLALNDGAMFGPGGAGFQRMNLACPRALLGQALEKLRAGLE